MVSEVAVRDARVRARKLESMRCAAQPTLHARPSVTEVCVWDAA